MKGINQRLQQSQRTIFLHLFVATITLVAGCKSVTTSDINEITDEGEINTQPTVTASLDSSAINLYWDQLEKATSYNVYRSSVSTDSLTGSPLQTGITDTTWTDTDVRLDSTYYYRVTPVADSIEGPASKQIKVTNFTADPIATKRLVGTHYYLWWGKDDNWADRYKYQPVLGSYDSGNRQVINQHIKWALEHGIHWFSIGWAGPNHTATKRLEEDFLKAKLADKMKFSILYETRARFDPEGSQPIDMTSSQNEQRLKNDLAYIKKQYFSRDNYLRINNKPVLFFYFSHAFRNKAKSIINNILNEVGIDPYIIAGIPSPMPPDVVPMAALADAVSTYDPYSAWPEIPKTGLKLYKSSMHRMHLSTTQSTSELDFMPVAIPGVHGKESAVLDTSPQQFKKITNFLQMHYHDARAVLVTSFNSWSYNTHIEPDSTYHQQYLDIVQNQIAKAPTKSYEPPTGSSVTLNWSKGKEASEVDPNANGNRILSFMAKQIILKNVAGDTVRNYNIGDVTQEPFIISGAYGTETIKADSMNSSGRWFGGYNTYTQFIARNVNNIASITIRGRAITDMSVTVKVDNQSVTKPVHAGHGTYTFNFQ